MSRTVGPRAGAPSRRKIVGGLVATGAVLPFALRAPALRAAGEPIKIGVINTFSKLAKLGNDNYNGMTLYLDQIGWQAGGRKIELVKEDDEFNPQVGLEKLRKMMDSDKVALVIGGQASNVIMAMINYIKDQKIFMLVSGAGTDAITWDRIPYLFRSSTSTYQTVTPVADYLANKVGKSAALVGADYTGGHDVLRVFKSAYTAKGGKIVREIYTPLNTSDYSPYLTDLMSLTAQVSFDFFPGTDAVRFVKQFDEDGLKKKMKLSGYALLEADNLPAQGDSAIGGISTNMYAESYDSPENRKFIADYKAKFKEVPSFYSEYGFDAARIVADTLNATQGSTDKDALAKAMVAVKFTAPRGPFRFDPVTHNVIQNIYIKEIVKAPDGHLTDKILATYKDVRDPGVRD